MNRTNQPQVDTRRSRGAHSPLVFRFQPLQAGSTQENPGPVAPFTELPEELKDLNASANKQPRRILNALLLLLLGLLLMALVAVFAYQLIFHPEMLANAGISLVNTVEEFVRRLTAGG